MIMFLSFALILTFLLGFWTGFTDAAYAISTVVGTRTLKPIFAVGLATAGNFVGMIFGSAVAVTIGTGIISPEVASGPVIVAALMGCLIFDYVSSWMFSLPISETHVLVGGLIGAGLAAGGLRAVKVTEIVVKVILPMITVPVISFAIVFLLTLLVMRAFRRAAAPRANRYFKRMQILSAFFFSVTDGTNDAQKVMGIATALLLYYGYLSEFVVPLWVILASYATLSLGTFLGGWRVVKTMATRITRMRPYQGFCVEVGSSLILGSVALLGLPVSSTHVAGGAIVGVGVAHRAKSVKWANTRNIALAWALSIPVPAILSFALYRIIALVT
ncbi:inorganic phosphate transporter [Candidatus Bathyarchaeota archaeon]|nr:inorganic phosphate transporter [Candidatus Bathyarchaeota archaeon]